MKRITYWVMSTLTVLVLLFSYRTSLHSDFASAAGTVQQPVGTTSTDTGATTSGSTTNGATAASGSSSASTTAKTASYTGPVVDTRWGPVQVKITVVNGKITAAEAVQYPTGNDRDQEINSRALPVLAQEVLTAQSAKIDTVSGATVTSDGYITSLQAAVDQANL